MTITNKEVLNAIRRYKNAKARIAELETELDSAKAIILNAMGDNDTATAKVGGMTVTVSNKDVTATRLDTKAVKAKYPQIAKECSVISTSKRFIVK